MNKIFTVTETDDIFQFKCQIKWKDLAAINVVRERTWYGRTYYKEVRPKERFCESCKKNVHLCLNDNDILENAIQGNCIALYSEIPKRDRVKFQGVVGSGDMTVGAMQKLNSLIFCRSDGFEEVVCTSRTKEYKELSKTLISASSVDFIRDIIIIEEQNITCKNQNKLYLLKQCLLLTKSAQENDMSWKFSINDAYG